MRNSEAAPEADVAAADILLTPRAVRDKAHAMLALARRDALLHFRLDELRLGPCADYVIETTRRNYPTLDIPFHARWRHFVVAGVDRWAELARRASSFRDARERGRAAYDLAIVSVLLDAGAGPSWRYRDKASGQAIGRSEGLAIASLDMFAAGAFSSDPRTPLRVDADALRAIDAPALERWFQVGSDNPLVGLAGRAAVLRRLGETLAADPGYFAVDGVLRPGALFDRLCANASSDGLPAAAILVTLLGRLGRIWPSRLSLAGVPLGDVWMHPLAPATLHGGPAGYVPFHKLSQWLSYSLIEPLEWAGVRVASIDALTGLAEYRNGGLLIDAGALALRDPREAQQAHPVDSPLVVEWRALTVALLDALADLVRERLGRSPDELPLAKILEGGAWAAGRRIARERRADGSPPLSVVSDGTVF